MIIKTKTVTNNKINNSNLVILILMTIGLITYTVMENAQMIIAVIVLEVKVLFHQAITNIEKEIKNTTIITMTTKNLTTTTITNKSIWV